MALFGMNEDEVNAKIAALKTEYEDKLKDQKDEFDRMLALRGRDLSNLQTEHDRVRGGINDFIKEVEANTSKISTSAGTAFADILYKLDAAGASSAAPGAAPATAGTKGGNMSKYFQKGSARTIAQVIAEDLRLDEFMPDLGYEAMANAVQGDDIGSAISKAELRKLARVNKKMIYTTI